MPEPNWYERMKVAAKKAFESGNGQMSYRTSAPDEDSAFARYGKKFDEWAKSVQERHPSLQAADNWLREGDPFERVNQKAYDWANEKTGNAERERMAERQRRVDEQIAILHEAQRQSQLREIAKREALAKGYVDLGEVEDWQDVQGVRQPVDFRRGF